MFAHLFRAAGLCLLGALLPWTAHAECGGTVQCIGVGPTPAAAALAHHDQGPTTFTMAFGDLVAGTASASQTIFVAAVTGPAGTMATLGTIALSGGDAADFAITGGTCSPTNGPVHGGAGCTITVAFNPLSAGSKTATVHVPLNPRACDTCITERIVTVTGNGLAPPLPVITSAASAAATGGQAFTYQITATNSPTSYGASGLPPGIAVNSATGLVSGNPAAAGTFNATVSATNAAGTGSRPLTITVSLVAPVITSPAAASATGGQAFSYQIVAGNLPAGFAATGLPPGLSVDAVGLISGTPTATGTFNVSITATNAAGTGTQALVITITLVAPVITSSNAATGASGQPFTYQITAANLPTSFGASGLPAGLAVDPATGLISGVPIVGSSGTYPVAISATNAAGTGTGTLSLLLTSGIPVITSTATASGAVSQPFSYLITATNLPTRFAATGLPAGLLVNAQTGQISGEPLAAGTFNATVSASNTFGTGSQPVVITIVLLPPTITSASTTTGFVGQPFLFRLAATGLPTRFTADGLPPGLILNPASGEISGTPGSGGSFNVAVSATNASGTGRATLAIVISSVPPPTSASRAEHTAFGAPLTIYLGASISGVFDRVLITRAPANGTATLTGSVVDYRPNVGFSGTDSFEYAASGPGGTSAPATVTITVGTPPAPEALSASASTTYETAVTIDLSASVRGAATAVEIVAPPAHGTAVADRFQVNYTPAAGHSGADSFTFRAMGPGGASSPATVSISVGTLAPTAGAATMTVPLNTATSLDLAAFIRGSGITGVVIVSRPAHGQVTTDGTRVTFAPANDYFGPDAFTYSAQGNAGTSPPAAVTVTVTGRPDPTKNADVVGIVTAQTDAARRFSRAQIGNAQGRMETLHRRPTPGQAASVAEKLASVVSTGALPLSGLTTSTATGPDTSDTANFWLGGTASVGERSTSSGAGRLDFETEGITAGVDRAYGSRLMAGLAIGAARDRTDVGTGGSYSRARAYSVMAYASYEPVDSLFVDGLLGAGALDFRAQRLVTPLGQLAGADRSGRQVFGSLAAGYEWKNDGLLVSPYARADFSRERLHASSESDAGAYALAFAAQTSSYLQGTLGVRAESVRETRYGRLAPRLRAEFRHLFRSDRDAAIGYADLPGETPYLLSLPGESRNALALGLGGEILLSGGLSLGLDYEILRAAAGENSQSIQLRVSQILDGRGASAWADMLPSASRRDFDIQFDTGYGYDDNVSRALAEADIRTDRVFNAGVRVSNTHSLGQHVRALLTAALGGDKYVDYNGLSRARAAVEGEIQYRASGEFDAPTWALFGEAGTEQYESRMRDGYRYSLGLSVRQQATDRIGLFAALSRNLRDSHSPVFDARDTSVRVNIDYTPRRGNSFYLSGDYRRGDAVFAASAPYAFLSKHEAESNMRSEADDVFTAPPLVDYRVDAKTIAATVGYNLSLGPRDSLDLSWRHVRSTPANAAQIPVSAYDGGGTPSYTVNQFFILYLLGF